MTPEQRLVAVADLAAILAGAVRALELAVAGVDALRERDALPADHADGVDHLTLQVAELTEAIAALANDRPPTWRIGATFRHVQAYEVPR